MNFNHLRIFWSVAKNSSYSRAAEELYVGQSNVSIQVKKLEEELGIDLFEQLGKKIYLTNAGEELFSYANKIFSLAEEANSAIQQLKGLHSGRLVIGASTTPGIYLLPSVVSSFQMNYPDLDIVLEISNTHKVQEQLLANQLDLGIVGQELVNDQLCIELLHEDELVVIVAPNHPLAKKSCVPLAQILGEHLILREQGSSTRKVVEEKARSLGFDFKSSMQLSGVEAIKRAVAANLGVSIVSRSAIDLEVKAGVIHVLSLDDGRLTRRINLIYHKDKKLSPAAHAFMSYLRHIEMD